MNNLTYRHCRKCDKWKLSNEFPRAGLHQCGICHSAYMKNWADNNRSKINNNQQKYQSTLIGRANLLLNSARTRSRAKGVECRLTHEDVVRGLSVGYCSKTFLPFDFELRSKTQNTYLINPRSPSLDKIDPSGIYEVNNVQYVCSWYNFAKGQMSEQDLLFFCKQLVAVSK